MMQYTNSIKIILIDHMLNGISISKQKINLNNLNTFIANIFGKFIILVD